MSDRREAADDRAIRTARKAPLLLLAGLAVMLGTCDLPAQEGVYLLPGKPDAGMRHFLDKGCARCHAMLGEGGYTAPDLGRTPTGHLSATQLVAMIWNHAPRMWERMTSENIPFPTFETQEIEDLFAFLYSVRSLDPPGDPEAGRSLLRKKGCIRCHEVAGEGGHVGPGLSDGTWFVNPMQWAQMMWNHAGPMEEAMAKENLPWPEFTGDEMVDLLSYVRSQTKSPDARAYPLSADPGAGRNVFEEKGCRQCHPVRGEGGTDAPDLGERATEIPRTLAQFASLMWNHAPRMREEMRERHIQPIQFSNKEMADLIAYLYAVRYFDEAGDAAEGHRVYNAKGCSVCHTGGPGATGPDLSRWVGQVTPVMMARVVWNHGPAMYEKMMASDLIWPSFGGTEMRDLIAYLNGEGR